MRDLTPLWFDVIVWPSQYGVSDERYHVHGGNSVLIASLVANLSAAGAQLNLNSRLTAVKRRDDLSTCGKHKNAPYELTLQTAGGAVSAVFEHVVLALPFATMRPSNDPRYLKQSVDVSQAGFSKLKIYAINNLGMSKNVKHNTQFKTRYWRSAFRLIVFTAGPACISHCSSSHLSGQGNTAYDLSTSSPEITGKNETAFQCSWEVTRAQSGSTGCVVMDSVESGRCCLTTSAMFMRSFAVS